MFSIQDICQYFRYLCEQHTLLQHSETSGQRVYEVRSLESAWTAVRTAGKQKDYLVRLLLPSITLTPGSSGDQPFKVYQVGLLVLRYHSQREDNEAEVIAAIDAAESVADQLVARVMSDSRDGYTPFANLNGSPLGLDLSGEVVQRTLDGSYSGVLYMFNLKTTRNVCPDCQPASWADGGANTPWPLPA